MNAAKEWAEKEKVLCVVLPFKSLEKSCAFSKEKEMRKKKICARFEQNTQTYSRNEEKKTKQKWKESKTNEKRRKKYMKSN